MGVEAARLGQWHRSALLGGVVRVSNLDSIESVSIAILVDRLGRLADDRMRKICTALAIAVDCTD